VLQFEIHQSGLDLKLAGFLAKDRVSRQPQRRGVSHQAMMEPSRLKQSFSLLSNSLIHSPNPDAWWMIRGVL
jgi:hypothetical protein